MKPSSLLSLCCVLGMSLAGAPARATITGTISYTDFFGNEGKYPDKTLLAVLTDMNLVELDKIEPDVNGNFSVDSASDDPPFKVYVYLDLNDDGGWDPQDEEPASSVVTVQSHTEDVGDLEVQDPQTLYWVDGTNGDDDPDQNGSVTEPLASVVYAWARVGRGSAWYPRTVSYQPGEYSVTYSIPLLNYTTWRSADLNSPATLIGVIDQPEDFPGDSNVVLFIGTPEFEPEPVGIHIEDLILTGADDTPVFAIDSAAEGDVSIRGCVLSVEGELLGRVWDSTGVVIAGNTMTGDGAWMVMDASQDSVFTGNILEGIQFFADDSDRMRISGNSFSPGDTEVEIEGPTVVLEGDTNVTFEDNDVNGGEFWPIGVGAFGTEGALRNNRLLDHTYFGLLADSSTLAVENLLSARNGWAGIVDSNASLTIEFATLADNALAGIAIEGSGNTNIKNSILSGSWVGFVDDDATGDNLAGYICFNNEYSEYSDAIQSEFCLFDTDPQFEMNHPDRPYLLKALPVSLGGSSEISPCLNAGDHKDNSVLQGTVSVTGMCTVGKVNLGYHYGRASSQIVSYPWGPETDDNTVFVKQGDPDEPDQDGTRAHPYYTIQRALSRTNGRRFVKVQAGAYFVRPDHIDEARSLPIYYPLYLSGGWDDNWDYVAAKSEATLETPDYPLLSIYTDPSWHYFPPAERHVKIEGFIFSAHQLLGERIQTGIELLQSINMEIAILNNSFRNFHDAISLKAWSQGVTVRIEHNEFEDVLVGISCESENYPSYRDLVDGPLCLVKNNYFHDSSIGVNLTALPDLLPPQRLFTKPTFFDLAIFEANTFEDLNVGIKVWLQGIKKNIARQKPREKNVIVRNNAFYNISGPGVDLDSISNSATYLNYFMNCANELDPQLGFTSTALAVDCQGDDATATQIFQNINWIIYNVFEFGGPSVEMTHTRLEQPGVGLGDFLVFNLIHSNAQGFYSWMPYFHEADFNRALSLIGNTIAYNYDDAQVQLLSNVPGTVTLLSNIIFKDPTTSNHGAVLQAGSNVVVNCTTNDIQDCNVSWDDTVNLDLDCPDSYPNNFQSDPLWVGNAGVLFPRFFLAHDATGQQADSPVKDKGHLTDAGPSGTTRLDLVADMNIIDMGMHYPVRGIFVDPALQAVGGDFDGDLVDEWVIAFGQVMVHYRPSETNACGFEVVEVLRLQELASNPNDYSLITSVTLSDEDSDEDDDLVITMEDSDGNSSTQTFWNEDGLFQ